MLNILPLKKKEKDIQKNIANAKCFSRNNKRKMVANSAFRIPDSILPQTLQKHGGRKSAYVHRLLSLLRLVKTIATWKTVIDSMQSLGIENFRVAYTRFLPLSNLTILLDITIMAKRRLNGKERQVSPLTPRPKLNGRQKF